MMEANELPETLNRQTHFRAADPGAEEMALVFDASDAGDADDRDHQQRHAPWEAIGRLEFTALCAFIIMSAFVIAKMAWRDWFHIWEPCTENTIIAKHEFCFNITGR